MSCSSRTHAAAGFTTVELVLVIVIVGLLGAIAGPRFFNNSTFEERAYYDELASSVRYAQKVAVASGCRVRVSLAANSYELRQQAALGGHCDAADLTFPQPVLLPTGQTVSGVAPSGITAGPPLVIVYDGLGRTNLAANQAINVGPWSMLIEAESGLVVTP
ncbi:MAG: prepilin-type cleavage/methylation domain-containing protein [Gammaproteobacteria bacterium]|nr:prepilin-type cleavage/methylation domain-containing protein [Gammaproteobacteria bacterium]MBT8109313.1 prepilin-type cleavage/methylation domain-containing protein [Gammaproteobacteria bacterium]NND46291.1 prepilin-type cleavage/methylation domain-containing protein [Woeseiaceae bacterium]NNL44015.1 prepilin-type cleavage/methylation domain-containing protein [Woeseiaceae bacterium]